MILENFNLSAVTGKNRQVLFSDFSITVEAGKIYGFTGPTGTGKTSLFNYIAGLELDCSLSCSGLIKDRMTVSYCFQDFRLLPQLSVYENIRLAVKDDVQKVNIINKYLERLQLTEKKDIKAIHLSGGEMQRCSFIRSLVFDSQLLLLDEPFSNQDEDKCWKIIEIIKEEAQKGRSIMIISHQTKYLEGCGAIIHKL